MYRAFVYSLLAFVVAASCILQYWGVRMLAPLSPSQQNRIALVSIAPFALALAVFRANIVVTDCLVLSVALFAGTLLSRQIGSLAALVMFLTIGAIADLISTHVGPTRWLADHGQPAHVSALIQFLAVSFRLKGMLVPVIGVADLMFFTICVSVVRRLGWSEKPALVVPLLGILSALGVGLFTGLTPAIPFLAAAVILYAYASSSIGRGPCHS